MSTVALSVPTIKVNNDVVPIVPNTFKYVSGDGETTVRAASTGGNNAVSVHTQNAETMFSKIMFSVHVTLDLIPKIRDWKADIGGVRVEASQQGLNGADDFSVAFKGVSMTNDPDINAVADGVIEIEMAGDKLE